MVRILKFFQGFIVGVSINFFTGCAVDTQCTVKLKDINNSGVFEYGKKTK
jgi:hypothetical protein